MGDSGSGLGGRDGGTAGVGKEVEDLYFLAGCDGASDDLAEPVPVDRLLGEESRVLEVKGLKSEGEIPIVDRPLLGEVSELPLAAAFIAAVVMGVGVPPFSAARRLPDHLWVRADQLVAAPKFQFLAVGSIQYLIIFPGICNPHIFFALLNCFYLKVSILNVTVYSRITQGGMPPPLQAVGSNKLSRRRVTIPH